VNTNSLIKHTGLAFTFILSSLILSKLLPNNFDLSAKYNKSQITTLNSFNVKSPTLKFGFALDTFESETFTVEKDETLINILSKYTDEVRTAFNIVDASKKFINPHHSSRTANNNFKGFKDQEA
jgi:hypothetical protein